MCGPVYIKMGVAPRVHSRANAAVQAEGSALKAVLQLKQQSRQKGSVLKHTGAPLGPRVLQRPWMVRLRVRPQCSVGEGRPSGHGPDRSGSTVPPGSTS